MKPIRVALLSALGIVGATAITETTSGPQFSQIVCSEAYGTTRIDNVTYPNEPLGPFKPAAYSGTYAKFDGLVSKFLATTGLGLRLDSEVTMYDYAGKEVPLGSYGEAIPRIKEVCKGKPDGYSPPSFG